MTADEAQAGGGPKLTDEHHSWMEDFFGVSTRPKPEAAAPGASAAPEKKEESSGGFFDSLSNAASAIGDAASSAVHGVVDAGEKVVSVATDAVGAVAETAIDVTAKIEQKVVDVIPLPDAVKGAATTAIDFQKGVGEGAVEGVKGLVKGVAHLAGAVTKESYDLATSEKAREETLTTVGHGVAAAGEFVETAVTDPSKAGEEIEGAVEGPADKVVQIGKSVYHSYEEAQAAGHGAEWIGKGELLMAAFDGAGEVPAKVEEMREWWRDSVAISAPGAIDLGLDEYLVDEESVGFLCRALAALKQRAAAGGPIISAKKLNAIVHDQLEFRGDRNAADFTAIADQFSALLQCETAQSGISRSI